MSKSPNLWTASIVKPNRYSSALNQHKFETKNGSQMAGEHGDVMSKPAWEMSIKKDLISLHQYACKSREQFEAKI
jgi:hypothetical protein